MDEPRHIDMDWGREETDEGVFTHVRLSDPNTGMVATLSLSHEGPAQPQGAMVSNLSTLFVEALQMIGAEEFGPEDPVESDDDD